MALDSLPCPSSCQPDSANRNAAKDDARAHGGRDGLEHRGEGADLGKIHALTLQDVDSSVAREMSRACNIAKSDL